MKTKIIIVVVTVVSLLTCLCVPTFAAETSAEVSDVVIDWSNSYATGFSNGLASSVITGSGIYGGLANGLSPYNRTWLWSSNTTFDASTGDLHYATTSSTNNGDGVAYFVFRGLVIDSMPSTASVVSYDDFVTEARVFDTGLELVTGQSTKYSVTDYESELAGATIVRCPFRAGSTGTSAFNFKVRPMVPPRYVSYDGFLGFVSVMMTEALSAGHDFLSFVSNSWVVLLPLVMWLTVAVIGAIKRFTSKG